MNKKEFIDKMLIRHMSNANVEEAKLREEEYEKFLDVTLDFDFLYENVVKKYTGIKMPSFDWLKEFFKTKEEYKKQQVKDSRTWYVYGKSRNGMVYSLPYPLDITLEEAIKDMRARRPIKLAYCGNNKEKVLQAIEEEEMNKDGLLEN